YLGRFCLMHFRGLMACAATGRPLRRYVDWRSVSAANAAPAESIPPGVQLAVTPYRQYNPTPHLFITLPVLSRPRGRRMSIGAWARLGCEQTSPVGIRRFLVNYPPAANESTRERQHGRYQPC